MPLKHVLLRDFLSAHSTAATRNLPMVHTTKSSNILEILNQNKLLTTECNVFSSEKLCYLFVGRPSYKYEFAGEAPYWMLPAVFVIRFETPPPFKRIYPFDSGAFTRRLLPEYITTFARDDYELGTDLRVASTLISVFFDDEKRYLHRWNASEPDFRSKYGLGPLHMQIEALNRLYGDKSNSFDDRAAAIELQSDNDIPLSPAIVLGVVVPEPYLDDLSIKNALEAISPNIETFGLHPVNVCAYFGSVYDGVIRIYKKFGIIQ